MAKRTKKQKSAPVDGGLTPEIKARIRTALREVWVWTSYARRLCIKRALQPDGEFSKCEGCKKIVAKVYADHINAVGDVDRGFIERLWISSDELQALCKKCHDRKTRQERKDLAQEKRKLNKRKDFTDLY